MVVCTYGSEPKSASPAWFYYDDAYIASKYGNFAGWLTTWAMNLPAEPQNTEDFCATDPPTDFPTAADWLALVSPPVAFLSGAYERFGNWIRAEKWSDLCQCLGNPTGGSASCLATGNVVIRNTSPTVFGPYGDYAGLTSDVTSVSITVFPNDTPCGTQTRRWQFEFRAADGTLLETKQESSGPWVTPPPYVYTPPAGTRHIRVLGRTDGPCGTYFEWVHNVSANCVAPAAPSTYDPPAHEPAPADYPEPPALVCATEQDVCTALNTMSQKLDWMRTMVDLIQRQAAPFAYVPKNTHAGLSGSGTLAVQGILALSVNITTLPSAYATIQGNPNVIWDAGYVTLGTTDGDLATHRIIHDPLLIAPVSGMITSVKYHLKPGVVATITTHEREP